jgi:large-conductance mechanosensitive channel
MVRILNKLRKTTEPPQAIPEDIVLLREIRDALKK